jgi:hypothetical protein
MNNRGSGVGNFNRFKKHELLSQGESLMSVNRRIFGLASSALVFAGMAFGQAALVCTTQPTIPVNTLELRAEGSEELVSDVVLNCNGTTAPLTGTVTATLASTGNLTITSKTVGSATEATLLISNTSTSALITTVAGTINSAGQVVFQNVTFPQVNFTMRVSDVRVNATTAAINQQVTEQIIAAAQGVALIQPAPVPVGLVVQGFATPTVSFGTSSFLVCNSGGAAFTVNVGELFAGAFKSQHAPTAANSPLLTNVPVYPANIPGGEDGSYVNGAVGAANFGTRIKLVFSGIPSNVTVSVPVTIVNAAGNLQIVLTGGGETGAFSIASSGTLTVTNGSATAIYEVLQADLTTIKSVGVLVSTTFSANTVAAPAGPITVTASYSPSPATVKGSLPAPLPTVPYFANTGTTLTGTGFSACQTTLLFPFVTNQANFETGIAIANAGLDNLNGGKSAAAGQSGACTITFYGSTGAEGGTQPTAPTAANFPSASNKPTTTIAPGTTHADTLTDVIGGPFQGYAIAVCPFLYARGFAFIEYGLTTGAGVVEGYLADVISSNRLAPLTYAVPVGNTSPETSGQ